MLSGASQRDSDHRYPLAVRADPSDSLGHVSDFFRPCPPRDPVFVDDLARVVIAARREEAAIGAAHLVLRFRCARLPGLMLSAWIPLLHLSAARAVPEECRTHENPCSAYLTHLSYSF